MAAIPKLKDRHLEALCEIIGDAYCGLTGSELGRLLACAGSHDRAGLARRSR